MSGQGYNVNATALLKVIGSYQSSDWQGLHQVRLGLVSTWFLERRGRSRLGGWFDEVVKYCR